MIRPLEHESADLSDDALADEAKKFLATSPARQLVAELLLRLRDAKPRWWSPESLRQRWSAADRMAWLAARPDLRQRITSRLTGLAPKAARKKAPDFQAALIDSVVDEGDVDARELDAAFEAEELAVYAPIDTFWRGFLEALPVDGRDKELEELATWLLEALLAGVSALPAGYSRAPILTPLDVRLAIDGTLWQTKIPVEIRVAIDRARLAHEREQREPRFGAAEEFAFATPAVLAATFSLRELAPVFAAAERAMGFGRESAGSAEPPPPPPPSRAPPPRVAPTSTPAPSARPGISPAASSSPGGAPASAIGTPGASPLAAAMMQASSNRSPRGSVAPVPPPLQQARASSPPIALPPPPVSQPPIALPPPVSQPPLGSQPPPSRRAASVVPPPLPPPEEFAEVLENELDPTTNPWEPEGRDTPPDDPRDERGRPPRGR